jgi:hypothetical protein
MVDRLLRRKQKRRDELLSAYLDDALDAEEQAWLEKQLATDPALRADLETLRQTVSLLNDLPQAPVPRNFILPLTMERRRQITRSARPRSARPAWIAPLLTAATALVALAFGVLLSLDLFLVGSSQFASAPASESLPAAEMPPVEHTVPAEVVSEREEPSIAGTEEGETVAEEPPVDESDPMMLGAPDEEAAEAAGTVAVTVTEETEASKRVQAEDTTPFTPEAVRAGAETPSPSAPEITEYVTVETPVEARRQTTNRLPLQIALGLAALGLLLATIWAWRTPH